MTFGTLARKYIPRILYTHMRALAGHYQYQERLGRLKPAWTAYGLLMAVRTAQTYGINSIAAIEFGVANGRGLKRMCNLAERLTKQSGIKISVFGFDSGNGLPPITSYKDNPNLFAAGDYPMQDIAALRKELNGRAELIIGDIRKIPTLNDILQCHPLGFASIDVDLYSSTKAVLRLLGECSQMSLLPITSLHFDDVWTNIHYSRFTGELLAIHDFNQKYVLRGIDIDRHIEHWHNTRKPWHASMFFLHTFQPFPLLNNRSQTTKIIK